MNASIIDNIAKIISIFDHSPLYLALTFALVTFFCFFRLLFKDLKIEHVFRHTLNSKIKSLKNAIKDGMIDKGQAAHFKQRYATLLNQKVYGVKNGVIQQEVIGIIDNSSEITDFRYFATHQYVLSVDAHGRLYFNKDKIKARAFDAFGLLVIGISIMAIGVLVISASLAFGLVICCPGLLLYFAGLDHFPAKQGMRKRAEKEIEKYYQNYEGCDGSKTVKK